jgi:rfaE bifunctional protein nucleotidyltransferase chain/domain
MGRVTDLAEAVVQRERWRAAGRRVVLTNGCFDLLHVGHVHYLEQARALGDALIVGVNGDASVRRLKGPGRPLVPAAERVALVAALAAVDLALLFEEDTADGLLAALRPDVYAKGGDWGPGGKQLPEAGTAHAVGAAIHYIDYQEGHSTSRLLQRILELMKGA